MEAIIIPNTPMIKKDPKADKFFLVVQPYMESDAKAAAVIKNTLTTDSPVQTSKREDRDSPIKPE